MEGIILYTGQPLEPPLLASLKSQFAITHAASADEAVERQQLQEADMYLLGTGEPDPVRELQKIYTADNHLSVVMLCFPDQTRKVKQAIQFAPFVGKNVVVVTWGPELDLVSICKGASQRTRQKRSFYKFNLQRKPAATAAKNIAPDQLGTFLDYAPIGAVLLSDTNHIVTHNKQAAKFFPALSQANPELSDLFSAEVVKELKQFIQDGHHPEQRKEITIRQRILQLTSSEVYNQEGQKHFLLLFNDVTDQRSEVNRIRTILEALPQMAWIADAAGAATYFTQGWHHYTGQAPEEATGRGWLRVVYAEDVQKISVQWLAAVATGKSFQQAARYRNAHGEYRWHLARASAIRNGQGSITMWIGTCTDIHDQMLLTEELERKVKERTHSLEVSNSELEQFAHVSSHDLQEPLRKIRIFAGLLKETAYQKLDPGSQKQLDKISSTAERMSDSLRALLNFTKLHREEKFISLNLQEIVAQVLTDLELMITQKAAIIHVAALPTIRAVPIQMQQLFYNLLINALKFSREGIPPRVEITCRQIPEQELRLYPALNRYKTHYEVVVADNGIGFEQQHAEKIFTLFQRLHNKTEFEGTGIGLSLVKKVVNNHHGEIRAVSRVGEGTSFHILLPEA